MQLDKPLDVQRSKGVTTADFAVRPTVSCLITTYAREKAGYLSEALESVFAQEIAPDQLVLVLDGPVGASQEEVITHYRADRRIAWMDVVRLPSNKGLAYALNAGLERCTGTWLMRMDSDDICRADRLRIQLGYIAAHPEVDILSSWTEEFTDGVEKMRVKSSPVSHDAVVQCLRWRNIIVHPSMMVRLELLRRVGGYPAAYPVLEDYEVMVRLALAGGRFHVLPAVLVRMRAGPAQSTRRGGWRYCLYEIRFRTSCLKRGFLNLRQYLMTTSLYAAFRLAGPFLRYRLYSVARTSKGRKGSSELDFDHLGPAALSIMDQGSGSPAASPGSPVSTSKTPAHHDILKPPQITESPQR